MQPFETTVALPLDQAEAEVRAALAQQGFGVLTEIDIAAVLQAKLGVERAPLKILGACNPGFAHEALTAHTDAALMLPCNVVLEAADADHTRVRIVDPRALLDDPSLQDLAADAAAKLEAVITTLA